MPRLLLAVEAAGNRKQLAEHLGQRYTLLTPERDMLPEEGFDLAILDTSGFGRWHDALAAVKSREQPVFLPVMLIVSRAELARELRPYWHVIDEFLVSPIERGELTQRVDMLLRAREWALTQRARLAHLVNHDQATDLPNKTLFMDRLGQAIQDATVLGTEVYVAVVQLSLGPILKSLGTRGLERAAVAYSVQLRSLLGQDFSLARLTTEQWALLLRAGSSMEDVLDACRRIERLAKAPIAVDSERVHVTPCIGIAKYPDDAHDADGLLDRALSALSQAERRAEPAFYSASVQRQALRYIRTEARLHEALDGEHFELWLQPKINLGDGQVVGAEALVRWRLPGGELVAPGNFVAVAEAAGLIVEIDRWMLRKACEIGQRRRATGESLPQIAVNLSAQHLGRPDFVTMVENTLRRYEVPAAALELELTETASADLGPESLQSLKALRDLGLGIALDDFGTGYSSLSYLHKLPITTLKIDRRFVAELPDNETDAAITRTIVALARNFALEIVAEGVETQAQADYLALLSVETGQGFLFARPMPEADFFQWMAEQPKAARRGS